MLIHIYRQIMNKNIFYTQKYWQLLRCYSTKPMKNFNKLKNSLDSNKYSLHVIGNGADPNPNSLILSIDQKIYLFNCSEGFQRVIHEFKERFKVSKIGDIFITSNKWRNISGFSGLLLDCYDSGLRKISLHGIECQKLIHFCTYFDFKLKKINYNCYDLNISDKPFIDDSVIIRSVPLKTDSVTTIAYFCKLHHKSGRLLIDKCFHMKIPRKLLSKLESGQSVVLESGQVIDPKQVHSPDEPEKSFLVIDCPNVDIIDSILRNNDLKQLINDNINCIECVVHFTPEDIINDSKYQTFIKQFSSETNHLIINNKNPTLSLPSMHRMQNQLNILDSKIFPQLSEKSDVNTDVMRDEKPRISLIRCQTGLEYVLRPSETKGISFEDLKAMDMKFGEESILDKSGVEREGFANSLIDLKSKQKLIDSQKESSSSTFPEVLFLGTVSSTPSSIRNVSSILVNTSADSSILLDCGEDTFGQLFRFYGSSRLSDVFKRLSAVFITHTHTDHHMGLIQIIVKHFQFSQKPLIILIPPLLNQWLQRFGREFDNTFKNKYIAINTNEIENIDKSYILKELRIKDLRAIPVIHTEDSFGVLIESENGKRIVFSGDAEPTDQLIIEGKDCDLLIHEATVEDPLVGFARDHFHSTFSEAIHMGKKMDANFTILTHFSPRYGKLPLIPDKELLNDKIGIAYDFMRFTLQDLNRLPILLPTLNCLYRRHLETLKINEIMYKRKAFYSN